MRVTLHIFKNLEGIKPYLTFFMPCRVFGDSILFRTSANILQDQLSSLAGTKFIIQLELYQCWDSIIKIKNN